MKAVTWIRMGIVVLAVAAGFAFAAVANDGEESEVTVQLADCPAAVQKALQEQASGGEIVEIEKETENGKVVYEAEIKANGKTFEVEVDEQGSVLEVEEEDEDDDGDDDEEDAS